MGTYFIKRLLLILPTWLVISAIVFGLSRCVSGDLVAEKLKYSSESTTNSGISEENYAETAHELGLDKPVFYAALMPAAFPDTLHRILHRDERTALEKLVWQYGNWSAIQDFHVEIKHFLKKTAQNAVYTEGSRNYQEESISPSQTADFLKNDLQQLLIQHDASQIDAYLKNLTDATDSTAYKSDAQQLVEKFNFLKNNPTTAQLYTPSLRWYGVDNQYNTWLKNFLTGNFGLSKDDQTVFEKLKGPLSITLVLGLSTLLFAFGIGIPLGVFAATNRQKRRGQWLVKGLFAVYSLPTFWLATLAAMFLTTRFYGLKIFPEVGVGNPPVGATILESLWASLPHFVLPILCMMIHPIAVIARQMQAAVQDILKKDFILTAKAKGLAQKHVIWRHAVRNSLTPMATLLAAMIPSLVTGAFAVELIFNLNGMGQTTVSALTGGDWSVVFAVLMLVSGVVLLSNLVSDGLYKWLNPR
jgi:peptide/nickel transport system permease protein